MQRGWCIQYIRDDAVDAALDRELRDLLSTCFTKPEDVVFRERRYFIEPPKHRWLLRDDAGRLIAHVAVHEKVIEAGERSFAIGGVAEVCVHPDYRRRGLVKQMLAQVHGWSAARGVPFAVLFGDPAVYTSSGYVTVENLSHDARSEDGRPIRKRKTAMVKPLLGESWPSGEVHLPGPEF